MNTLPRASSFPIRSFVAGTLLAMLAAVSLPAAAQDVDPPARVARLAEAEGQIWIYSPEAGDWIAAQRNQPLTSGDRIATDNNARADLQIGSTSVRLDAATEMQVLRLDDAQLSLQLIGGSAIARIRDAGSAGAFEVVTDEGRFQALAAGTYRFDHGTGRSDVTVYNGAARYVGRNSALSVNAGQRAEFWIDASGAAQYSTFAPTSDTFLAWSGERDRRESGVVAQRYASPEMTGVADLDAYGAWEQTPDYGPVWIPAAVATDWAPYSQGHWAWVAPWGWTWVDDAPWGFAPFHYGRWVYLRDRWCWTPGARSPRPVYAPALVGWVGGPGGNGSRGTGGRPAVGWFPLAPREVYVPSYRVSSRYAERINVSDVNNVTIIRNVFDHPQGPRDFENRRVPRAVTVVPSSVMAERRPVGPAAAQYRQTPWARDLTDGPAGRAAPLLRPPVPSPLVAARSPDPANLRPPPGFAPRDRGPNERDGREAGRPAPGTAPSNAMEAGPVGNRSGWVPPAPGRSRQPGDEGGRPEQRTGAPTVAGPQGAERGPNPVIPQQAPRAQLPQNDGPSMRALPVRRGEDRPAPPLAQPQYQTPNQGQPQAQPQPQQRFQRPPEQVPFPRPGQPGDAPRFQAPPRPMESAPPARPSVEMARPPVQAAPPVAQPQPMRPAPVAMPAPVAAPAQVAPAPAGPRPEAHAPEQRGGARPDEPRRNEQR